MRLRSPHCRTMRKLFFRTIFPDKTLWSSYQAALITFSLVRHLAGRNAVFKDCWRSLLLVSHFPWPLKPISREWGVRIFNASYIPERDSKVRYFDLFQCPVIWFIGRSHSALFIAITRKRKCSERPVHMYKTSLKGSAWRDGYWADDKCSASWLLRNAAREMWERKQ